MGLDRERKEKKGEKKKRGGGGERRGKMGKLAPQVTIAMTGIAEMYYVLKLTSLRFAFIAAVKHKIGWYPSLWKRREGG